MEILLAPEASRELRIQLAAATADAPDDERPAVRLTLSRPGEWGLALAPPRAGDHVGFVDGLPFAVAGEAAEEAERLLVGWTKGRFIVGEVAEHNCGVDPEIRE